MLRDDSIYGHRHSFTESNGSKQQAYEQLSSSLHASCEVKRFEVSLSLPGKQLRTSRSITYLLSSVVLPRERAKGRNRKPIAQTNSDRRRPNSGRSQLQQSWQTQGQEH